MYVLYGKEDVFITGHVDEAVVSVSQQLVTDVESMATLTAAAEVMLTQINTTLDPQPANNMLQ